MSNLVQTEEKLLHFYHHYHRLLLLILPPSPLIEMMAWSSFPVSGTTLFFHLLLGILSTSFTYGAVSKILYAADLVVVTNFMAFIFSSVFSIFQFVYSWYNRTCSIILLTLLIFWRILEVLDVSGADCASFIPKII